MQKKIKFSKSQIKQNGRNTQKQGSVFKRFAEIEFLSNIYKILHKKRVVVFSRDCILKASVKPNQDPSKKLGGK